MIKNLTTKISVATNDCLVTLFFFYNKIVCLCICFFLIEEKETNREVLRYLEKSGIKMLAHSIVYAEMRKNRVLYETFGVLYRRLGSFFCFQKTPG